MKKRKQGGGRAGTDAGDTGGRAVRPSGDKLTVRCTQEWAEWVAGLADHCYCPTSTVIEQALHRFADGVGFLAKPPRRNPGTAKGQGTARRVEAERSRFRGDGTRGGAGEGGTSGSTQTAT